MILAIFSFVSMRSSNTSFSYKQHVYICVAIIYRLKIDPDNNQLPVVLIAQTVENCAGVAEVRGSNLSQMLK